MAFFRFLIQSSTLSLLIISTILLMQLALVNVADANPRQLGGRKIPSSHPPPPNMAQRQHTKPVCCVPPIVMWCCAPPPTPSIP
ncbi:hypothetical protein Pint_22056 [Pistacia integerrima]|uniref:Uncharacterized protein n=1 Tax=Pistacia integerrima TaxID=434235 RepID=A0ACC0YND8_9ROSI|nr:hypothetical protein Pint_22056 [Pistacia integerrima]